MNTAARVEILRNYKDLESGHVDVFNALETLINHRTKRIEQLNLKLTTITNRDLKKKLQNELNATETELKIFQNVERRHLTMVDFIYKGLGTTLLYQRINDLEQQNADLKHILDKIITANANLLKTALKK